MNIHFIAIGGAIMHQLALELHRKGYKVTGSDDSINEPSKSRLIQAGLMPNTIGFDPSNIHSDIDIVILGMHAKFDNVELSKAMEMGLTVMSFPEFIYHESKEKKRVVIAGSHGKTSITSMVMHCLQQQGVDFDFVVGSSVRGFDRSVKLTNAPIIVIEGDEYLASPILKEPKFIFYKAHIAVLSGIEWDHINVFKTKEIYNNQFKKLVSSMVPDATLYYYNIPEIYDVIGNVRKDISLIPYQAPDYDVSNGVYSIRNKEIKYSFDIFGKHNMENLEAAKNCCLSLGIFEENYYQAMQSFSGAGRRLELLVDDDAKTIYKDFAHSPSKLIATTRAIKEKYTDRPIVACFELHTFSTLNREFLPQYAHGLDSIDFPVVYVDKEVLDQKGGDLFTQSQIRQYFQNDKIQYVDNKADLLDYFKSLHLVKPIFLMMSSGTFSGLDLEKIYDLESTKTSLTSDQKEKDTLPVGNNSSQDTVSIYQTNHLDNTSYRRMLLMFTTSYILFIIPPLFLLISKSMDKKTYNIVSSCLNFQLMITVVGLSSILARMYFDTFGLVLFGLILGHIYYTHKAIQQLLHKLPINIPKGLLIMLPKIAPY